jgi:phospholipid/cholesterol/gamma-HCH transport system permease protein
VRAVEEWLGDLRVSEMLTAAGEAGGLAVSTFRAAITPPYPWWRDCIVEFSLAVRRCALPLVISMITFAIGIAVLFVGRIVEVLGTPDRLTGLLLLGFTREPAEWVTAMIFAGVAGSAITADLGARKIREELDALNVLGLDVVRTLVVPRVVAVTLVGPVLGLITLLTSQVVNYALVPLVYPSVSYAGEWQSMASFIYSIDFVVLVIKLLMVGAFVGVISCYKGLSSKGGAEGVGRAVNQGVVVMFLGLWVFNGVFNSAYLALFPSVLGLRG